MRSALLKSRKGASMYTPHRRHVAQVIGALLSVALFVFAAANAAGRDAAQPRPSTCVRVVVQKGDTLWSLAKRFDVPGSSLPQKVSAIRAANGLVSAELKPGQELRVPVRSEHEAVALREPSSASTTSEETR
ncbi:MAG: LysM peptidoglycan-binding domain-containing protein [Anaerosomatales bacterium]|nr:LysM peptidoglycan-binding domain-containing protein [Anaerosomatales bacterium]